MRTLAACMLVLLCAGCGDDTPPPVDASVEHMTPTDLGRTCMSGATAGCFQASTELGGACQERCVTIGNWPAICTGICTSDADCAPAAPHCTDVGTGVSVCMTMSGNPNEGCQMIDAPGPIDAPAPDGF